MQTRFDAIVLAGQDPNRPDPLAEANGVANKVLIEVGGKAMITHVVEALKTSALIGHIVIVGVESINGMDDHRLHWIPGQGRLLDNVVAGLTWLAQQGPSDRHVLLTSGDIPLMTAAQIDWFLQARQPLTQDLYWGIVERRTMEATFPESKRSYLRLVEGHFCNGGLFLGKLQTALARQAAFRQLVDERKNVLRQLRLLGLGVVVKFFLNRLRLDDLLKVAERAIGLTGGAIILPFAETGMDVDKPHQLDQVRDYWRRQ
jgi:molybdopterin-guanine dinucleotide biosynthesis protein A